MAESCGVAYSCLFLVLFSFFLVSSAVHRYDEWLNAATVVDSFPSKPEHVTMAAQAQLHYEQLSLQFPCEAACSVVTMCDVLVEACVRAATVVSVEDVARMREEEEQGGVKGNKEDAEDAEGAAVDESQYSVVNMWNNMDQEAVFQKGLEGGPEGGPEEGPEEGPGGSQGGKVDDVLALDRRNLLRVVYHGDVASMRLELYNIGECLVGGRTLLSIVRHMLEDCARVPGGRGRAGMPREPVKKESERGAELNELLTFLSTEEKKEGQKEEGGMEGRDVVNVTPEQLSHTRTVNLFQDM